MDRYGRKIRGNREPKQSKITAYTVEQEAEEREESITIDDDHERILKGFDLNHEYGPTCGISRLERWERAKQLGLDPPDNVRELIEQHSSEPTYTESIWNRARGLRPIEQS